MVFNIPVKSGSEDFSIPSYGFGTWTIGGSTSRGSDANDRHDLAALENALDLGVTHFDTAELYAAGHAEALLGEAIGGKPRERLFITSKVFTNNFGDRVRNAAEQSLRRLKTDYLDLYLIHRKPTDTLFEKTLEEMMTLKELGRVRHIGVSNFSTTSLKRAQKFCGGSIVTNQVHYNLAIREIEHDGLLRDANESGILLTAWRPIEKGIFGKEPPEILQRFAEKYQRTPIQIALNWLLSQKNVCVISKTSTPEHLNENIGALGWEMSADDIEVLRKEYPHQKTKSDVVPLDSE